MCLQAPSRQLQHLLAEFIIQACGLQGLRRVASSQLFHRQLPTGLGLPLTACLEATFCDKTSNRQQWSQMWVALQVHRFSGPPCVPSSSGFGIWISLCSKSLDDHVPASGGGTEGLSFKASSAFYTSNFGLQTPLLFLE